MTAEPQQRSTGRKIGYGAAITLSSLVILLCVVGIVGTWIVGSAVSSAVAQALVVVENTADGVGALVVQVDQRVAGLEETSTAIGEATNQLSENVTDKGLVLALLPEEREQKLVAQANELQEALASVREALQAGVDLYRAIDNLPLVSLPRPDPQAVADLEESVARVQGSVEEVVQGIQEFRAGVSGEIDRVTGLLEDITARLVETRQKLDELAETMEALAAFAVRLQSSISIIFSLLSVLVTLFLGWIVYTQVEVIRLFVRHWQSLGEAEAAKTDLPDFAAGEDLDQGGGPASSEPEDV